jgi:hypothetical protein
VWSGFNWIRIGSETDHSEHGNEPSGYIKDISWSAERLLASTLTMHLGVILYSECVWSRSKHRRRSWTSKWYASFTQSHNDPQKFHCILNFILSSIYMAWTVFKGTSPTLVQQEANMIPFPGHCLLMSAPCISGWYKFIMSRWPKLHCFNKYFSTIWIALCY